MALSTVQGEFDAVAKSGSPALPALNAEISSVCALTDHVLRGSPSLLGEPQWLPKRGKN